MGSDLIRSGNHATPLSGTPFRADTRRVNMLYTEQAETVVDWSDSKVQRILTALLEMGTPVPTTDVVATLRPAVIDAIQAAMLRRELAKYGRFAH